MTVKLKRLLLAAALGLQPLGGLAHAQESTTGKTGSNEMFRPGSDPERPRSDVACPLVSFAVGVMGLAGVCQWWQGQPVAGFAYASVSLAGLAYARRISTANDLKEKQKEDEERRKENGEEEDAGFNQKDPAFRKSSLGLQTTQWSAGMSLYHGFRTAVRTRQPGGQYEFLTHEETPFELMAAPFDFRYLARQSTWVPLTIGTVLALVQYHSPVPEALDRDRFTGEDGFYAGAFSYNAGTHEEAMFRGWLMPVLREWWGTDFWANTAQAGIFAVAHINTVALPLPQGLLGWHLGYVTQKNGWQLGESIFIHTWWDVLAFATLFHYKQAEPDPAKAAKINPVLWLPPLHYTF